MMDSTAMGMGIRVTVVFAARFLPEQHTRNAQALREAIKMTMPLARRVLAATVLFGTASVSVFAQSPREFDEYGFRRTPVSETLPSEDTRVQPVYDNFGSTGRQSQPAANSSQEVAQLRRDVKQLSGMCAEMYDQVNAPQQDKQDIQFVSMMSRLDGQAGCFDEPCAAPCGDAGCCDPCNPCCQPCCRCGYYAGFAALFVRPHVPDDVPYIVDPAPDNNTVGAFNRDWEFTPRVWVGYTGPDGLGARATYWQLDSSAGPESIVGTPTNTPIYVQVIGASTGVGRNAFAGIDETFIAGASLEMQAIDLELTREWRRNMASVMLGVGLRYGNVAQRFNATVLDSVGVLSEQVIHHHGFEGVGPTISLIGFQPFGDTRLGVYGTIRGSVLFGEVYQDIYEVKNGGANIGQDTFSGDEVMAIGEIGFGLQYSHPVSNTAAAFIRAGYEGQVWFDAGGPTSMYGDLGLHGLLIAIGFEG
jgi:hypothetical protein